MGVSIDGLEQTHDGIRNHVGLFRRVLDGLDLLQKADIPVGVITTVTAQNIGQLPNILDLLISSRVSSWQIQPVFSLGRAPQCGDLCLSDQMYVELGKFVKNFYFQAKDAGLIMYPADSFGYFTDLDFREPPWAGCQAGLVTCSITCDGKIKGCLSLPDEFVEGDLRKQDLWDIWFNESSFAYNRQNSPQYLGPNCISCEMAEKCRGGCSAMSYGSTGKFHNDPYCFRSIGERKLKSVN